jgi:hypothetical protein
MSQFLKIYQIYYEEKQLEKLIFEPYYNKKCTVFFENWVIKQIIDQGKHKNFDYFGVVSHDLLNKIKGVTHKSRSEMPLNEENLRTQLALFEPDALSLSNISSHDPITEANNYHPYFIDLFSEIVKKNGYKWTPEEYQTVFYCNHFVAKSEIYEAYVNELLSPSMEIMKGMPELMNDSKYYKKLPEHLKKDFGVDYYPYQTFLCERLFSFYAHVNNLNCIQF